MKNKLTESISSILGDLKRNGTYLDKHILEGEQGGKVIIDGKEFVMLCSNNYLGLASHPKVKAAAKKIIDEVGVGLGCSRLVCSMRIQEKLEEKIAEFKNTESAIAFQTGYDTNLSAIGTLADKDDILYSDSLNHASIIDGSRFSGATIRVYPHKDMDALEKMLREDTAAHHKFIITDAVFSMEGDIAPVPRIVELAEKYDAMTYIDDAHGEGVLGKNGRGIADHFDLRGKITIQMATLSKAIGCMGGYIAGSQEIMDFLFRRARPFVFATGHLPPPVAAAALAALEIIENEPQWVAKLWENTHYFKKRIKNLGLDYGESETPIIPIIIGDGGKAREFSRRLYAKNIYVQSFSYPIVPEGKARLRIIISALHTIEQLDRAIHALEKISKELSVI
jgi:glycine C-acetyltransferase